MNPHSHLVDLNLFKRLWSFLSASKIKVFSAFTLIILARMVDAWIPIKLGWLAQEMMSNQLETSYFLIEGLKLIGLLLLGTQLDALAIWIKSDIGSVGLQKLRKQIFHHIQNLKISYFDKEPVGKLMTRTMSDVDQINQMFSESLLPLFGSLFLFTLIFLSMFWLDYRVAFIMFLILPLIFFVTNYFRKTQRNSFDKMRTGIQEMNGFVNEHLQGMSTIRRFGIEKREEKKFDKYNEKICDAYQESTLNFSFYISANDFLQNLSFASVFLVVALQGPFDIGLFFTFNLYIFMFFRPLLDLSDRYNVLQSAFAAAERIFTLLDEPSEQEEGIVIDKIETVEFRDVWFAYHEPEWVLKGVSFKINSGESVALVGQTGSGKTTVLSLLLRFYMIQKGEILINGLSIETIKLSSLRKAYSVVLQDPVIFSGTLEENVSLFDSRISTREVQKGLDYVNFLKRDPIKPTALSAGEKQLVSLARAVVHHGRFLMLDEATANIDPLTEKTIQDALSKLLHGRSALVIAHRLTTIKDLNKILVFSHGQLVESGSHESLIKQKGMYEKLYRLEF